MLLSSAHGILEHQLTVSRLELLKGLGALRYVVAFHQKYAQY